MEIVDNILMLHLNKNNNPVCLCLHVQFIYVLEIIWLKGPQHLVEICKLLYMYGSMSLSSLFEYKTPNAWGSSNFELYETFSFSYETY